MLLTMSSRSAGQRRPQPRTSAGTYLRPRRPMVGGQTIDAQRWRQAMTEAPQQLLGALCRALVAPTRGHYIAEAALTVPMVGPDNDNRNIVSYHGPGVDQGTPINLRHELDISGEDTWVVHRAENDRVERRDDQLYLYLSGQQRTQHINTNDPTDIAPWSFWTEDWLAELIEPYRLLGVIGRVTTVTNLGLDRFQLHALPHYRLPSPYTGAASPHIVSIDFVIDIGGGRIHEMTSNHADGETDHYRLLTAHDLPA